MCSYHLAAATSICEAALVSALLMMSPHACPPCLSGVSVVQSIPIDVCAVAASVLPAIKRCVSVKAYGMAERHMKNVLSFICLDK